MADDRLDQLDYYTLLGVADDADVTEIRLAFRRFARKYHPDRFAGESPQSVERATAIYRRGSEAHEVLTSPTARRAYDLSLAKGELRLLEDAESVVRRHQRAASARAAQAATAGGMRHAPPPEDGPSSIRVPQARAFADRARKLEQQGDLRGAWKALQTAAELEPGQAYLTAELRRVAGRLR